MKQETPHTLDALCSQLSNLSMQCENCIDHALDAMQVCGACVCVSCECIFNLYLNTFLLRADIV